MSQLHVYKLGQDALDGRSPVLLLPPGVEIGKPLKIDQTTYGPRKRRVEVALDPQTKTPGWLLSLSLGRAAGGLESHRRG